MRNFPTVEQLARAFWLRAIAVMAALLAVYDAPEAAGTPKDPLTLVVSLQSQHLIVYRGEEEILSSPVSTGRRGHATPTGVFSILQKRRWHRSNIYSQAPMPFMQRLTWSGIALHAGRLPGYPASHGCIRLPDQRAQELFALTGLGAHVVIDDHEVAPVAITHPALFQPAPPPDRPLPPARLAEARIELVSELSDAQASDRDAHAAAAPPAVEARHRRARQAYASRRQEPLRIYITRRTGRERIADMQKLLAELGHDPGAIDGLMGPRTGAAIRSFQQSIGRPASGAYSADLVDLLYQATGVDDPAEAHLYVRQGFRSLFEAPVRLRDPDLPLGTHLFTALHFEEGARNVAWLAFSPSGSAATSASQALDRLDLSAALRGRISALLTPGTSLLISDQGLGLETGKRGTDFIVRTAPAARGFAP